MRASRTDATTTSVTVGGFLQDLTGQATSQPLDGTAFRAAPYFGWNWQIAPQWVAGIEGDVGFADQTTTFSGIHFGPSGPGDSGRAADSFALRTSWDGSARGRVGFLVTPTTLVYATGGAAWQHFGVTSTCASAACMPSAFMPVVVTNSTTRAGWTIGGGVETALWSNWFVRAEYRYADFGSSPVTIARIANPANAGNTQVDNLNIALRTHAATFGLAYKFDWGTAPVIAKN